MYYGLKINLNEKTALKISVPDLVRTLVDLFSEAICYNIYNQNERYTVVQAKSLWNDFNSKLMMTYKEYDLIKPYMKIDHICGIESCFNTTAHYSCKTLDGVILYNEYGEEVHEIYERCTDHISNSTKRLMKTAEIVNLTPDQPTYWTKIVSWQATKHFWSQQVWQESDGNYETGYFTCSGASPHLGPFTTREKAIEAAKKWKPSDSIPSKWVARKDVR